jgi:hypothetical protein
MVEGTGGIEAGLARHRTSLRGRSFE